MIDTKTQDTSEQLFVSSQRTLPTAPFPRKHIHSVFDDLQHAMQAAETLRAVGYDASDIHIMNSREYVEAIEQRQTLVDFISSIDYDMYLREARQGHYILVVRLSSYMQMEQVRDLLAPYSVRLMRYIDTWTITDLLP